MERSRHHATRERIREIRPRSHDQAVASRRAALESLRSTAVETDDSGLILITGESGAGKSWLWRELAGEMPHTWRFAAVEVAPALEPIDFLSLIADRLGLEPEGRVGAIRLAVARALQDEAADGRSWVLVVENAHHASAAVWTEIETLCDGPRRPQSFATTLLVGQTELARRFDSRHLQSMATRLTKHIHLLPLDVDEAVQLAALRLGASGLDPLELEELHRDAGGNPRRLLRLVDHHRSRQSPAAQPLQTRTAPAIAEDASPVRAAVERPQSIAMNRAPETLLSPITPAAAPTESAELVEEFLDNPPLIPSRPPLREEEGMIEVGWSGSLQAEIGLSEESHDATNGEPFAQTALPGEETIEDHYAALQAWTEWARNRGRLNQEANATAELPAEPTAVTAEPDDAADDVEAEYDEDESVREGGLRAETPHDHAPYSQLFTKLKQSS